MNYALVGCGRIAPNHLQSAIGNHLQIVGICDKDIGKARALARKFGLPESRCHADYRELVPLVGKDGFVSVATDSGSHHRIVMDLLHAGLHVLCEKPIALSLRDADEMIACAAEHGLLLGVCQQNRLNDASLLVKKALDRGAFGTLSHGAVCVRWSRGKEYYRQDAWRGKWASDGGTLMNQCIHGLDLLRYFMGGEISQVFSLLANRAHPYLEVEDLGVGVLRFENGALATIEGTSNLYRDNLEETLVLVGEKGTVKLGGEVAERILYWNFSDEEVNGWGDAGRQVSFSSVYGDGHVRIFEEFGRALREHRSPSVDGKAGRDALELVLALYESGIAGSPVTLPLQEDAATVDCLSASPFAR
jgi:predicted dehydrogenase